MGKDNTTIIICCAGMGTRLGIGTTKALVNVAGKSLIRHQLEQLDEYDDVRIVAGFQAERLINEVNEYRKDILFAFNYEYQSTGPLESVNKAILCARDYAVVLGGDMIIHPNDLRKFIEYDGECIGYSTMHSAEPIFLNVDKDGNAIEFSEGKDRIEWSGLVKFKTKSFKNDHYFVHQMISPLLPFRAIETRGIDIDTSEDYEKVVTWVNSGFSDDFLK